MAKSTANPGWGCTVSLGNGAEPEVYTVIAELLGVPGVGATARTSEVTTMTSPEGWAEYIKTGVKEQKPITLPINFVADNAQQLDLITTKLEDDEEHSFQITFTDETVSLLTFDALVVDSNIDHDKDSQAQGSITIRPTGKPVWSVTA